MNRTLGTHAPWALLDGFPLLLNLLVWLLLVTAILRMVREPTDDSQRSLRYQGKPISKSGLQTRVYKRAAALLLIVGAAGGFLPSLSLLVRHREVYSVNRVAPHSDVDASLLVHIPLAVLWCLAMAFQFWTGGRSRQTKLHRVGGWIAVACGLIGLSLAAGLIWTYLNDFRHGISDPRAAPGFYTIALGIGVAINVVLLVFAAKRRSFLAHKDFALMALLWSLDPGVHRAMMWTMRMLAWDYWAPENTSELGIALAKLPANLILIAWAISAASRADRMNKIILFNVAGQSILFNRNSHGLMQRCFNPLFANSVTAITLILALTAFWLAWAQRTGSK